MKMRHFSAKQYHLRAITDAFDTFENRETTVSHIFRKRHPFLGNRTYGAAMFETVRARCGLAFSHALEIGGGRGDFARNFMTAWVKAKPHDRRSYTIVDLSPALLRSQRHIIGRPPTALRSIQADAEQLPLRNDSFSGLVIANEMIADLDVWRLARKQTRANRSPHGPWRTAPTMSLAEKKMARTYLRRYRLDTLRSLRTALFPVGLARLLEDLHQIVDTRSRIVITEYFDLTGGGTVLKFPKHRECSLSLPIVCELARQIGFSVESVPLAEFLDLRVTRPVASRAFLTLARDTLGHDLSVTLPYSPADLRRVLADPGAQPGGLFSRVELEDFLHSFHVLILHKRHRLSPTDFHSRLVLQREPNIIKLRGRTHEPCLIMTSPPYSFVRLNAAGEEIWDALDGATGVGMIAGRLSRRQGASSRRALADTIAMLKNLFRRHFIRPK